MYVVEYNEPYFGNKVTKKFKGKYAPENAFSYAKNEYENYHMQVEVTGYEVKNGKNTGAGLTWKAST